MKMPKIIKKIKWKRLIIIAVLAIIVIVVVRYRNQTKSAMSTQSAAALTVSPETRDIKSSISSNGVVEPLNTYEVSSLVQGKILSADFEEGDVIEEGDTLYQIATDDLDTQINNSQTAVTKAEKAYERAKSDYQTAQENYNEALTRYNTAEKKYGTQNVNTTVSGIIKTLYVKNGDNIQEGSQIAEVYDNSYMLLSVPFAASLVTDELVGKSAQVSVSGETETLQGKVTKAGSIEQTLSGNRVVKTVTIRVKNPGGITSTNTGMADIGSLSCSGEGTFKELEDTIITSDRSGKIALLCVDLDSKVKKGDTVLKISRDSIDTQMDTYYQSLKSAKVNLDAAKYSMDTAKDGITEANTALKNEVNNKVDYSITAPISGQIISKNKLAGDVINTTTTGSLCVIYDLSALKFKMNVDELDILSVKDGQEVIIKADALSDVTFKGMVTNVKLLSQSANGVTQYPVTVRIDVPGSLLPGMNVTGEIVTSEAKGVMAIPNEALMEGDVVYVEDPTVKKAEGSVPAGFKEVKVKTGITDGSYVEITSGLTGNENLYIANSSTSILATGMYTE